MVKLISEELLKPGEEPPKIEFPCDYPIKVLGDAVDGFSEQVVSAVQKHTPESEKLEVKIKESSNGRFRSVTVVIRASGAQQIENIFTELKAIQSVKIVL